MPGASLEAIKVVLACLVVGTSAGACTTGSPAAPGDEAERGDDRSRATTAPTWFRDVEPIVQVECAGCHTATGAGGFALDQFVTTSLATLVAERVVERLMPPWPPGPAGAGLVGSRRLDERAIATIVAWEAAGSPAGDPRDHAERAPRMSAPPERPADARLELPADAAYREPASPFVNDEIRCFVLDLPARASGAWVTAVRWHAGVAAGVRSLGGVVLSAAAAEAARARSGRDGRSGFECGGGLGDLARGPSLGASGTGSASEGASVLPGGTAVHLPTAGALLLRVHYAVKHLALAPDRSGVELWLADEVARRALRPLLLASVDAPVDVPCPSGVSEDPAHPCSRQGAFARLAGADAAGARARADALLATCGTTLEKAAAGTREGGTDEHFIVPTACTTRAPFDGTVHLVEAHLQTRGASVRVEAERDDGGWSTLLDIPRWRWDWEGTYLLAKGVPVKGGRGLRVSCTFDNGTSNQWSALTGEAGHNATALPPLLAPTYLIAAPHRAAEACSATLGLERSPYRAAAWPTPCHEAQAIAADVCGEGAIDLLAAGCSGVDEDRSVAVLGAGAAELRAAHCPGTTR